MVTDRDWLKCKGRALVQLVGGEETAQMLLAYHTEHYTFREIAEIGDLPESTVRTRIARARTVLRSLGLLPPEWDVATPLSHP